MIDLSGIVHHPAVEENVDIICAKTRRADRGFFRVEMAYFLCKMASSMGATVVFKNDDEIPVNAYVFALATSGYGKGHSINIVEGSLINGFKKRFTQDTLPALADRNFWIIANDRAICNNTNQQEEYDKVVKEYRAAGSYLFTFDEATVPAVKQLRKKLIMASVGALNFQVDEIGSNLDKSMEMLTLYLELYDQGLVKEKLTKNNVDNQRGEDLDGKTPANMMAFGTPAKVFDGSKTEELFNSLLQTGYARRSLFAYGNKVDEINEDADPAEVYHASMDQSNNVAMLKWGMIFENLADPARFNWKMVVEDEVGIALTAYRMKCEKQGARFKETIETEAILKAELEHRHGKVIKVAGAYAFVDGSSEIELDHLMQAILLVEESGKAFEQIMHRDKVHVRLGKYLADANTDLTEHDLIDNLSYYPKAQHVRRDMMTLATAWGYTNNVIIKKSFRDGVEFFRGETLQATDLEKLRLSYSGEWAYNFSPIEAPFEQLHELAQEPDMHWANHTFKDGHRSDDNAIAGFNMVVIDADGSIPLLACHEIMKEYKFFTYTTKRHQTVEQTNNGPIQHGDRFRLVLPMNYTLELDGDDYKEFMNSVMDWLPFPSDRNANQRSKKWETNEHTLYHYNLEGQLLDALPFIPKTKRNEQWKEGLKKVESLDNLERWFAQRMVEGGRNNHMIRFALTLLDAGMGFTDISLAVHSFNRKLSNPLDMDEVDNTVMVTVAKRLEKLAA